MIAIYVDMIIEGHVKFEQVPTSRKAGVEQELLSRGYAMDGNRVEETA